MKWKVKWCQIWQPWLFHGSSLQSLQPTAKTDQSAPTYLLLLINSCGNKHTVNFMYFPSSINVQLIPCKIMSTGKIKHCLSVALLYTLKSYILIFEWSYTITVTEREYCKKITIFQKSLIILFQYVKISATHIIVFIVCLFCPGSQTVYCDILVLM
jgi:hypothetical protein